MNEETNNPKGADKIMSTPIAYVTCLDGYILTACRLSALERIGEIGDGDGERLFYFSKRVHKNQIGFTFNK